jgi:hypothetical protein
MYKLIIGSVRVTVNDDSIKRDCAATLVRQAIAAATQQGKLLSHVEISMGDDGPEIFTTDRVGYRSVRKTLKQSMLDGIGVAAREKLFPSATFSQKDVWFDGETGQDWTGEPVRQTREEIIGDFEEWLKSKYPNT